MAKKPLPNFEQMLRRVPASTFLQSIGYPVTKGMLEQAAHRGDGPPFVKFGNRTYYDRAELVAWAESKLKIVGGKRAVDPPQGNEEDAAIAA